jgi:hypothetical protein
MNTAMKFLKITKSPKDQGRTIVLELKIMIDRSIALPIITKRTTMEQSYSWYSYS